MIDYTQLEKKVLDFIRDSKLESFDAEELAGGVLRRIAAEVGDCGEFLGWVGEEFLHSCQPGLMNRLQDRFPGRRAESLVGGTART